MIERSTIPACLLLALLAPASASAQKSVGKHYDWRYANQLSDFAERIQDSMIRLERHAEKTTPLEVERVVDGVGVVVGPRRVITPGHWLEGAEKIWATKDGKRLGEAKVIAREKVVNLLLLELDLPKGMRLQPVEGFAQLENHAPTELVYPTSVGQGSGGVTRGVALREDEVVYVGGVLRNGVPGFDGSVRVRVLCVQPTPDFGRSVGIDVGMIEDFLEKHAQKKPGPAP